MSLKEKTIAGFKWSFIDTFSRYPLTFFIGILLARILSPSDYGLVGMAMIFISLARVFIDAGFSDALIRKVSPTQEDYSSVFIFNIITGLFFFFVLFILARPISIFFNEPRLLNIIKAISLGLIINSTSTIQFIILKKKLDFKTQTKINVTATITSGIIAIIMAIYGYGPWSLVFSGICASIITSILSWHFNTWRPQKSFKLTIIKEHFSFGSKIMLGSLINVVYNNMHNVLIGKIFSTAELGFYTRANQFQKIPAENIDIIVRQVTYPVLATFQSDTERIKEVYRKLLKATSFIVFVSLFVLAAVADSLVVTLIGEKWSPCIQYLQLLCFVGVFFPLISINSNILNVKGRSDLSLYITILKIIISIPSIILGYFFGIKLMIVGMVAASISIYGIVIYLTEGQIKYSIIEQLNDLKSSLIIAILTAMPLYLWGCFLTSAPIFVLVTQIFLGFILLIFWGSILNNEEYILFKRLFMEKFLKRKNDL